MAIQNALGQDTNLPGNPTTTTQAAGDNSTRVATTAYADRANNFGRALLQVVDQKAQNTNGGTFTSGAWRTRDLQTVRTNEISGASVATNQITLPAGTYYCEWSAPAHNNASIARNQTRIFNITDSAVILLGGSGSTASNSQFNSLGSGRFTLSGTKALELQHQTDNTRAGDGFGVAANFTSEIYAQVKIWTIS